MIGIDAYPLAWPEGWKRTVAHKRHPSAYQVSLAKARDDLTRELRLLARSSADIVLSTNISLRRDGLPYANQREPDDPGVATYWIDRTSAQRVIACDAWRSVRENMRAVGLAVAAFRMIERTRASEILDRAFMGFAALPPANSVKPWRNVLGLLADCSSLAQAEDSYRRLSMIHHPDRGGSNERMAEVNQAIKEAREELMEAY